MECKFREIFALSRNVWLAKWRSAFSSFPPAKVATLQAPLEESLAATNCNMIIKFTFICFCLN